MSARLAAVANALEVAAGATTAANPAPAGYWKRIAAASETLAGATSTANATTSGYMLRTAVALESVAGTSGAEKNVSYAGYLKRIVDALEVQAGSVENGSLEYRLESAALNASFGGADIFENGTFDGNDTTGWAFSRCSVGSEKLLMVNASGFNGFARYTFPSGLEDGATYRIEFDVLDFVATAVAPNRIRILGGTGVNGLNNLTGNGHYSFDMIAGNTSEDFQIACLNGDNFSLDNFTCIKL